MANTAAAEPVSKSSAPTAGPTMITKLSMVLLTALAAARSSSPASCGIIAATAGAYGCAHIAAIAQRTRMSAIGVWSTTDTQIRTCTVASTRSQVISSRTRSKRSAMIPP